MNRKQHSIARRLFGPMSEALNIPLGLIIAALLLLWLA